MQILTNNNFPMEVIDKTIKEFLQNKLENNPTCRTGTNKIEIFYESQMTSYHKIEEKQLSNIVHKYIKPADDEHVINFRIFYKNIKLKSKLIKNRLLSDNKVSSRHHVVYRYDCNQGGCNSSQSYYRVHHLHHR